MKAVFSHKFKIAGIVLVIAAAGIAGLHLIYGVDVSREGFFVFHSVREIHIFEFQKNGFADEIILLSFIAGFTLIVFSKEKKELRTIQTVRIKALFKTIVVYTVWLALVILFSSGGQFLSLLVLNILLPYIIYLALFHYIKPKELKKRRLHKIQRKILKSIT
jgi:hypothetical protein